MHTEAGQDALSAGPAFARFLDWCKSFLPDEKYKKFSSLVMHPLPTVELVHSVYDDLKRGLHGEDRYVRAEFSVPELEHDFLEFLENNKDDEFWRGEFFDAIKTAPNSILVIDFPETQNTEYPEPTQYLIKLDDLTDVEFRRNGVCHYLAWKGVTQTTADNRTIQYAWVFDDEYYRTYRRLDSTDWTLYREVQHSFFSETGSVLSGPGYCPAKAIASDRLHSDNYILRSNPITRGLASLDKILFWEISIEYYETYGAFPMYWMYKELCAYEDEMGNACENGFINYEVETGRYEAGIAVMEAKQKVCPACKARSIVGAGTVKEVDAPTDRDDADLREPMGYVGVDANALSYLEKRLAARKLDFYRNCVGRGGETPNEVQAINEAQVQGNFESKQSRLLDFKKSWEETHTWSLETKAMFRYGRQYFQKATAYYGVEFYLKSEAQLQKQLESQRKAGAPQYQISALRLRIDSTQYRENDEMRNRARVLSCLEPWPDLSYDQVLATAEKVPEFILVADLELKANFAYYVQKFERENLPVVRYGAQIPFDKKISIIQQTLLKYVNAQLATPGTRIIPVGYGGSPDSASRRNSSDNEGK